MYFCIYWAMVFCIWVRICICGLLKKKSTIVSSLYIINTEYIYTKASFIFHISWFPKISQSIHFRLCWIPWLDQHLILLFGIQGILNIDNSICGSLIVLVFLLDLFNSLSSTSSSTLISCGPTSWWAYIILSLWLLP